MKKDGKQRLIGKLIVYILFIVVALSISVPSTVFACACGCGVFNVGTRWTMATEPGLSMFMQYSYMNQNKNWHSQSSASPDLNDNKEIRTSFYTLGIQYMVNRSWGIMAKIPYGDRYFKTTDDNGNIVSVDHKSLSDVRLMGMYTGFSPDMSTALLFGLKLPTGPYHLSLMDRDTQPGTGTTDLLLGGYHMGQQRNWGWYIQGLWRHAMNYRDGYRPGDSYNISLGVHYDGLEPKYRLVPLVQVITSIRSHDSGVASDPDNTGFQRLFISPGIELDITQNWKIHGDFEFPVYTHVNGYQLVAPWLFNTSVSYHF